MKKVFKRNQVMITTLALMIAGAGYLNYSGEVFDVTGGESLETVNDLVNQELLDISDEDLLVNGEIESYDLEIADSGEKTGTPGEAVLTSGYISATEVIASAKVSREQVRASSKEMLQALIDNEQLSAEQRETAVSQLVGMTAIAEMEVMVETLLEAKGFTDVAVTLTEESADVVIARNEITDANRAQIEDIVTRKTEIALENIIITPIETGN